MIRYAKYLAGLLIISALLTTGLYVFLGQDSPRYNVVMVSMDTTRADRMGVYGHSRNNTPNLEDLSQDSMVFENAVSQAIRTIPSHTSVFTGQYPSEHQVVSRKDKIPESMITIAEVFANQGYQTAAFVDSEAGKGGDLRPKFGYSQGFDTYHAEGGGFEISVNRAMEWMNNNLDESRPFFLLVHGYDAHVPYTEGQTKIQRPNYTGILEEKKYFIGYRKPAYDDNYAGEVVPVLNHLRKNSSGWYLDLQDGTVPVSQEGIEFIRWRYDNEIARADSQIGRLIDELKRRGLYDKTVIIVLGDHGETLGEHKLRGNQYFGHNLPYDNTVRVPLIIKAPGLGEGRFEGQVELLDIMPTVIDLAGLNIGESIERQIQGTDIQQVMAEGGKEYAYVYEYARPAVRTNGWKYIKGSAEARPELYNLTSDPNEQVNLIRSHPEKGRMLKQKLESHIFGKGGDRE